MLTKKQIYIIAGIVLFLIVLAYFFYRKGKNTVTLQALPGELPGNPQSGNVTGASNDEIKRIANDLYSDMNGFNGYGHTYAPYEAANLLNDIDLIKLYNTFNSQYQKDSKETLTAWISNERYTSPEIPAAVLARLKKLNAF